MLVDGHSGTVESLECVENCVREQEADERYSEEDGADEVDYVNKFHLVKIHTSCVVGPSSEILNILQFNNTLQNTLQNTEPSFF